MLSEQSEKVEFHLRQIPPRGRTIAVIVPNRQAVQRLSRLRCYPIAISLALTGCVQARQEIPAYKTEIQIAAACSRTSARFCARESRLATDDAYQRAPRARRTPR